MKRLSLIAVTLVLTGMVFGIGLETSFAATPTEDATQTEHVAAEAAHATEDGDATEAEPGVVGMFGINWKLFLAQLINFGIVLFVLWKFVWKPVTSGLSERTEKIENSLEEARKIAEDRETFDTWKNAEISEVRKEASGIISAAKQDAEALRASTLEQTKAEQVKLVEQTRKQLDQEKAKLIEDAKSEIAEMVVSASSTILKGKVDSTKDKQLIDDALKQAGA